ncbi:putative like proteinous-pairing protein 2 [Glarea lozoyensis 74030]|uniref:Putative like proteinous-pairing protein 2 n=1 Tax=Glarea lozoyensis (strain ATCC 74030 / MF5533) TaxID=1104152 RepID=H0EUN3_GLAL7|nr:putative like proteinous-pairing protein 2 [Glarea lozoyensis 74030]
MTTIVFEASTTTSSPAVLKPKNEKAKVVKKTGKGKEKVVVPVESEVEMEMPEAQMEMGTEEDVGEASTATSSPAKAPVLNPKNDKSKVTKAGGEKKSKVTKKEAGDTKKDGKKDVKAVKEGKDVKEKVEKVNGEEAEKLILEYLREQNRPYGATDLSANLRGKVCVALFLAFQCFLLRFERKIMLD